MFIQCAHAHMQATTHENASFKVVAAAPQTPQVGNLDALRVLLLKSDGDADCKYACDNQFVTVSCCSSSHT